MVNTDDWRYFVRYIYANELKKEFDVYGSFYDLKMDSDEVVPCRNVLEIYHKEYYSAIKHNGSIYFGKPDALFIMMNPGSSKPSDPEFNIPELSFEILNDHLLEKKIIKAKPDTTQYQVMRVMKEKNWDHVRVLNLFDIREAKSSDFIKKLKVLNNPIHSIFSPDRIKELDKALNIKSKAPVICAWGINPGLLDLAGLCLQSIPKNIITGIPAKDDNLYYHPLPSLIKNQIEWLDNIIDRLAI